MMRIVSILLLCIVTQACHTTGSAAVTMLPDVPPAPSIREPEKMAEADKRELAQFYRDYAVYKDKLNAWKKRFK